MMQAIGHDGSTVLELAAKLGLSESLVDAINEAVSPLLQQGRIEMREDRLVVTEAGQSWMHQRLAAL
jgi:coproporphyrinogen III oxidase-like Fe-S oxidoreductase